MEFQPFSSLLELIYLIQLCDWHTHYYSVKPVYSYRLKQGNHEADKAEREVFVPLPSPYLSSSYNSGRSATVMIPIGF